MLMHFSMLQDKFKRKISLLCILCGISLPGVFGQEINLSGDWTMRINNGTKNDVKVDQTGDSLIFWIKIGGETRRFTGKLQGKQLHISSPVYNRWPGSKSACHDNITALQAQYPQYKVVFNLNINDQKLEGTYRYPENISCEEGNIAISVSAPFPVAFIRVSYIYWISGKKIYKAPSNRPDSKSILTESVENEITGLAIDKDARRIYWSAGKYIYSIQQNGKGKQLVTTAPEAVFNPHSPVVDNKNNKLLWVEGDKIISTPLDRKLRTTLIKAQNNIRSLAVDPVHQKLYWLSDRSGKIKRVDPDGSNTEDLVTDATATSLAIDPEAGYLYWTTPNKIKRALHTAPQQAEALLTGRSAPKNICIDKRSGKLYWTASNTIWRSDPDGTGEEKLTRYSNVKGLATGSAGPARYNEPKIEGSLLIRSAAAGRSLLQQLVKNDTWYQVLSSEDDRPGSPYNLTDARLLLIWGENFPDGKDNLTQTVFTSSDPAISYREFDTWRDELADHQKEKYGKFPLWLNENRKIREKTWNITWEKLKNALGPAALKTIRSKNHMLVLAIPRKGVLPGMKSFTMNDAETRWYLNAGTSTATMRFLRKPENGETETISDIYAGDPFFIEIRINRPVDRNSINLSYFINNNPLRLNNIQLEATTYGNDGKTYRTSAISLQEFEQDGDRLYSGISGHAEAACKAGSVFKAAITDASLFNNGRPPTIEAPVVNPVKSVWHQSLGEAVSLADTLNIPESEWENAAGRIMKTYTGKGTTGCTISLGDYAAMLLLKKYYIRQMKTCYNSLEKHKDDDIFQYGFWEMMAPHMKNEDFPPGNIKVDNGKTLLRNAFSGDYILARYKSPRAAKQWMQKVKKEGFIKYLSAVKRSLNDAEDLDDKDMEKLINFTGFGFNATANLVKSHLQKKPFPANAETVCETVRRWEPDTTATARLTTISMVAKQCGIHNETQTAATNMLLATSGFRAFPPATYNTSKKFVTAVYSAALGSGAMIKDPVKFNVEGEELTFTDGSFTVAGAERYALTGLKATPVWTGMLSFFGAGLGITEGTFDSLKFTEKLSMADAYAKVPSLLNEIDRKGALEAYKTMSRDDKIHFLLLLAEAGNLKKSAVKTLTGTQQNIVSVSAQFAAALDVAVSIKDVGRETGEAGALREGLPAHLRDKVFIIKDDVLPGAAVRLEYEPDADGFLKQIKMRAGKAARAQNIAARVPALTAMKAYEQIAGNAGNLYRSIQYWYQRTFRGMPAPESPAREAMQEVRKLHYSIENSLDRLVAGTADTDPQRIAGEIQKLSGRLGKHRQTFEAFIANPVLARGFAADRANITTGDVTKSLSGSAAESPSADKVLNARAARIQRSVDLLNRSPQAKALYQAIITQAAGKNDPEIAARFMDRLGYFNNISPEQLTGMQAFINATGDVELLSLILQRGIPRQRALITYNRKTSDAVLKLLHDGKDSPGMLRGIAAFLHIAGKRSMASVEKLRVLAAKLDAGSYETIFKTIKAFEGTHNFKAAIADLSSDDQNSFAGALGRLKAARELVDELNIDKQHIIFEQRFHNINGNIFRDVDILVKDGNGKIVKLVSSKEYSRLSGLFDLKVKQEFARDLLLAYRNGVSPSGGILWKISKKTLGALSEAVQRRKLLRQFLRVFTDSGFKAIICGIDAASLKAFRKEIEARPETIFQFF